jgi:hypothetical protein
LWSCHVSDKLEIPLTQIERVTPERPATHLQELRAPGTAVPGLIKAGTYYSKLGRAFWYVQGNPPCLCLDLKEGYYKQIVLGSAEAGRWASALQAALAKASSSDSSPGSSLD